MFYEHLGARAALESQESNQSADMLLSSHWMQPLAELWIYILVKTKNALLIDIHQIRHRGVYPMTTIKECTSVR